MTDSIDDTKCPICGCLNSCHHIDQNNSEQESCWCEITDCAFPVSLLAHLPEKFKNKACICENCAQAHLKTDSQNGHSA